MREERGGSRVTRANVGVGPARRAIRDRCRHALCEAKLMKVARISLKRLLKTLPKSIAKVKSDVQHAQIFRSLVQHMGYSPSRL